MEKKNFKLYTLLITLMVTSQIICFIYARRQVGTLDFPVNVSGIIFPLDLYLIEIIGECYGYEYSRQAVWLNTLVHGLFLIPVFVISALPYPAFMHDDLTFSYRHLIDISWVVVLGSLMGTFLGDMFSARYVPKLKILLDSKYRFLRLFLCQAVSEAIVTSSYLVSFLTNNYTFKQTMHLVLNTIIVKLSIALVLYPIIRSIIGTIKRIEGGEGFDFKQDYRTLAYVVNQDKINFKSARIK